jgi:hypothetical protein
MALFGNIQKFQLNQTLASNSPANPDDVINVKQQLRRNGYYDEPSYGMTPYPDKNLFDGIKKFQKDNWLAVDGIMNPDGETIRAMQIPILLASNFAAPEVLAEKKDYFDPVLRSKRKTFADALNKIDVGEREFKSIMKTYDFEGGDRPDGNAVSGLIQDTVNMLNGIYKLQLSPGKRPADLTPKEKANLLVKYGDYSFERVGGRKVYDKLPDEHAAQTLYDTVVRHGASGGSLVLRKALNVVRVEGEPVLDEGNGRIGPATLDRFLNVEKDKSRRKKLYDALAEERLKRFPNESSRFDHFRVKE